MVSLPEGLGELPDAAAQTHTLPEALSLAGGGVREGTAGRAGTGQRDCLVQEDAWSPRMRLLGWVSPNALQHPRLVDSSLVRGCV